MNISPLLRVDHITLLCRTLLKNVKKFSQDQEYSVIFEERCHYTVLYVTNYSRISVQSGSHIKSNDFSPNLFQFC
jgi:hypothetical protein